MLTISLTDPRLLAIVDRFGDRLIALFCTLGGLMSAAVLAMAVLVAQAHAAPVCGGNNLYDSATPAQRAEIDAEADKVPNGTGRLWRISQDGKPDSYLFGTMHVTDPRVLTLPPEAQKAFEASTRLVIETTDVLDQQKAALTMLTRPDLTMLANGQTLEGLLPEADRAMVADELKARGIPLASVRLMQPWVLTSMLALPGCEMERKGSAEVLDIDLARRAQASGKAVEGLETALEQIEAMASLPVEDHVRGLVETVRLGDRIEDVFETMIDVYVAGHTARLVPTLSVMLDSGDDEAAAQYAAFEETMINARNRTMAARLPDHLKDGGAFVAVGALHIPGEQGLVAQLQRDGHAVTAVE